MQRYYSKKNYKRSKSILTTQASTDLEEQANESKKNLRSKRVDLSSLDWSCEKITYLSNDYDAIRRSYLQQDPFQQCHMFPFFIFFKDVNHLFAINLMLNNIV